MKGAVTAAHGLPADDGLGVIDGLDRAIGDDRAGGVYDPALNRAVLREQGEAGCKY